MNFSQGLPDLNSSFLTNDKTNEDKNNMMEYLNNSFINIPLLQDQDIIDIKCPIPIDEPVSI